MKFFIAIFKDVNGTVKVSVIGYIEKETSFPVSDFRNNGFSTADH